MREKERFGEQEASKGMNMFLRMVQGACAQELSLLPQTQSEDEDHMSKESIRKKLADMKTNHNRMELKEGTRSYSFSSCLPSPPAPLAPLAPLAPAFLFRFSHLNRKSNLLPPEGYEMFCKVPPTPSLSFNGLYILPPARRGGPGCGPPGPGPPHGAGPGPGGGTRSDDDDDANDRTRMIASDPDRRTLR
eukprot:747153-Hanusia_phi.AAC.1